MNDKFREVNTPIKLKPFFPYFGSKYKLAKLYPSPIYETLIEPFAGSACYSLHYPMKNVLLYDISPVICGIWDYLIHTTEKEILSLPSNCEKIHNLPIEIKNLIGFWMQKGPTKPSWKITGWQKQGLYPNQFWGDHIKQRIAAQLKFITHWSISQKSYQEIPNAKVTWFIDPPYSLKGKAYEYKNINYSDLSKWCLSRNGQIIVCEQIESTWLPFSPLKTINSIAKTQYTEGVYLKEVI